MTTLVLTERDMEVLALLEEHHAVPLKMLLAKFQTNPCTGEANANPLKACERRITALRKHGYVELDRVRDRGKIDVVARLARRADKPLHSSASRRRVAVSERAHHVRTLEAVAVFEQLVKERGGRVVTFRVEAALRSEKQRGRRTRRGERFASFPDAVCTVALATPSGERIVDVALEYVTSKYTDADIKEKAASFRQHFAESFWFADRPRTAARVTRVTGSPCSILS